MAESRRRWRSLGLQLASRVQQAEQQATATSAGVARGLQSLSVTGDGAETTDASASAEHRECRSADAFAWPESAESPRRRFGDGNGAMGQTNGLAGYSEDDIRQRIQDAVAQAQRQGGAAGDMANVVVGMLGGMMGGGDLAARAAWWRRVPVDVAAADEVAEVAVGWRFQRVQSDPAAWRSVLSGRQRGARCDELFVDWSPGREARL